MLDVAVAVCACTSGNFIPFLFRSCPPFHLMANELHSHWDPPHELTVRRLWWSAQCVNQFTSLSICEPATSRTAGTILVQENCPGSRAPRNTVTFVTLQITYSKGSTSGPRTLEARRPGNGRMCKHGILTAIIQPGGTN